MKINYWSQEELDILTKYYGSASKEELLNLLPNRTWSSILTKAQKTNINKRPIWTEEEDLLLVSIYSNIPLKEVCQIFSARTYDAIIHRAQKLGLNSFDHPIWTDDQKNFIVENWEKYPDIVIGQKINKTRVAVKRMRNLMGLHRQDKTQRTYDNISKYIRGNIYEWKKASMEACGYQCVITGSKDFEIHHLYPVNQMINNVFDKNFVEWKPFNEYTQVELDRILYLFIEEQNKYPLGVCVDKRIHLLFHHLYGQYNTTEKQWYQFEKDFKNGLYKMDIIA